MSQEMDEDFAYFYRDKGFGPAVGMRPVPAKTIAKFETKLPNQLLTYWQQYGFSGYGNGRLWIVDPDEYEPVLEAWIGDTPLMEQDAYYLIARSAFGKLYFWGTKGGYCLSITSHNGLMYPTDKSERVAKGLSDLMTRTFFASQSFDHLELKDHLGKPLFERALKKLGPLAADEMYGFEPALALGGSADLKNLRKVKAVEHLVILAQIGERQVMRDIVKDAKSAGLL